MISTTQAQTSAIETVPLLLKSCNKSVTSRIFADDGSRQTRQLEMSSQKDWCIHNNGCMI